MELPQIIALSVGIIAAAIVGLFAYAGYTVKKRTSARIFVLFAKGASSIEIVPQLVAEGLDQETAEKIVEGVVKKLLLAQPTEMLQAGHSKANILKDLIGRGLDATLAKENIDEAATLLWFRRWWFLLLPAGIALVIAGAGLAFFGMILRDGNRTGKWVTFPFAGGITMTAGACVAVMGITMVALVFGKTG